MGMSFQSQTLCLQRDSSAAGKGVEERRRVAVCGFQNFRLGGLKHPLIIGIFPDNEVFQNAEQSLPLLILFFFCREFFRMRGRIIHKTRPDNCPCRRQRTSCPPQMQGRRMPMPDRLLPRRLRIDFFQRQCHLNQFFRFHLVFLTSDRQSRRMLSNPEYHNWCCSLPVQVHQKQDASDIPCAWYLHPLPRWQG